MAKKLKEYNKITTGFVIQSFVRQENGEFACVHQEFVAGDQVDRENANGDDISGQIDAVTEEKYEPFYMVQPKKE